MKNYNILKGSLLLIILVLTPGGLNSINLYNHKNSIVFLDVGQGDSTLICTKSNKCGLIDTGKRNTVIKSIKNYTTRKLEFLILTHSDWDHIGKTLEIIRSIGVQKIFVSETEKSKDIIRQAKDMGTEVYEINSENDFYFSDYFFDVLWPINSIDLDTTSSNDTSTAAILSYNNYKLFMGGDLSSKYENKITENSEFNDITVLKISHHGSKHSTSDYFLSNLHPKIAIISVGKNSYGHPSPEVLQRLSDIPYFRTDLDGDIKILLSIDKTEISTQNTKKSYIILN